MNCVLFAKVDQVFSLKKNNKTLKKYWKVAKNTGKVREFCQSGKVGTLLYPMLTLTHSSSFTCDQRSQ